MIEITRAATGYIYPTTREKEDLTAPYYLIKFVSVSTKNTRYCWVTDSSSYPDRYQKFQIIETSSAVSGTNQVNLDNYGMWDYYIYEYTGTAPSTETGLNEVEQGQADVLHTATNLDTYGGYQSTYKQYE